MTRELERFVGDHVAAEVVSTDELKGQYLFGQRDVARLLGFLALVCLFYYLVFSHQEPVLRFLLGQWWDGSSLAKMLVALGVLMFVPLVAHCYGVVAKSLMKLIKME